MNIIISEKSSVHGKLTRLGATFHVNPAHLAAGIIHAALNSDSGAAPIATACAPAAAPAMEAPAPAPSMGLFKGITTAPQPAPANA